MLLHPRSQRSNLVERVPMEPSFLIEADATEDKGARHTMEDASVMLLDVSLDYPGNLRCAHFAIYDGHGGRLAAEYARKHLHQNVLSAGLPRFLKTDKSILQESAEGGWQDGATAVFVWVLGQRVVVANIGDAKAVLARSTNGSQNHPDGVQTQLKAIVLTREHKPIFQLERARIEKAAFIAAVDTVSVPGHCVYHWSQFDAVNHLPPSSLERLRAFMDPFSKTSSSCSLTMAGSCHGEDDWNC
ncbi:hypothetical protein GLYMA_07G099700v4 [Glycine max]|uniref:PPM-type phosphatase domain-containing protein n=1 Tax=Glycine max TaxID=3847 RepID=A0A0R0J5S5_SOYBN|nr:hypothetical protein GYH30_017930 [Glycine max]KRH48594.1 hypothetical protein GLYMA_07G099700v4 [Glycine max]